MTPAARPVDGFVRAGLSAAGGAPGDALADGPSDMAAEDGLAYVAASDVPPAACPPAKAAAIRRVVDEWGRRRDAGEIVPERTLAAEHPELMPELARALLDACDVRKALIEARKAGAPSRSLAPLSDSGLNAPIDDFSDDALGDSLDGLGGDLPVVEEDDPHAVPTLGGYKIVEEVGGGGQAVVFRAVQESTGRPVAVKVMFGGAFASSRHRERFEREAAILAALDHPNLVSILDKGRTADGSFFLVMPFIGGWGLGDYLARLRRESCGAGFPACTQSSSVQAGKPAPQSDVRRVLGLFAVIARAVGEAHRMEIVHRDLKPSNVRVDGRGDPHVLDFGLARPVGGPEGRTVRARTVTATGQVVGSLPWASPEQASGVRDLDVRSDVYALGVMLYEAVAGVYPYEVFGPVRDVLENILTAVPPPPTARPGHRFGAAGDAALGAVVDGVVLKALSKSPADRYADAAGLAADLENALAGRPTVAGPVAEAPAAEGPAVVPPVVSPTVLPFADGPPVEIRPEASPSQPVRRVSRRRTRAAVALGSALLIGTGVWVGVAYFAGPGRPFVQVEPLPTYTNSAHMKFFRLPAGTFQMGSPLGEQGRRPREQRHYAVIPADFYIARTEVTRGQYHNVMGGDAPDAKDADLPATGMTYADAEAFCRRLGDREGGRRYRLPTATEWEFASRARSSLAFGGTNRIDEMGWYDANSGGRLHPVASKMPNHWGLYDMHGGAAEWCADDYQHPSQDLPAAGAKRAVRMPWRVICGGNISRPADECRSAFRDGQAAEESSPFTGFRPVLDVDATTP